MYNILICDDQPDIVNALKIYLAPEGYKLFEAFTGFEALEIVKREDIHLILLDIMMPGMDGINLLKKLRKDGITTPALFLTAKTETYQKIEGLDAGADDYLPKPFATGELLARVRAMLRRKDNFVPDLLHFGDLVLNRSTYEIAYNGMAQSLSGKEFQVMEILMQQPGMIVTAEQLITHIWGWETDVDTSVIWVHISNIRKKLDILSAPVAIRFVRNAGYILEATL